MSGMNRYVLAVIVSATGVVVSSAAWAALAPPLNVPEPGVFGIVAAAAGAVIVAARLRNKR